LTKAIQPKYWRQSYFIFTSKSGRVKQLNFVIPYSTVIGLFFVSVGQLSICNCVSAVKNS